MFFSVFNAFFYCSSKIHDGSLRLTALATSAHTSKAKCLLEIMYFTVENLIFFMVKAELIAGLEHDVISLIYLKLIKLRLLYI